MLQGQTPSMLADVATNWLSDATRTHKQILRGIKEREKSLISLRITPLQINLSTSLFITADGNCIFVHFSQLSKNTADEKNLEGINRDFIRLKDIVNLAGIGAAIFG